MNLGLCSCRVSICGRQLGITATAFLLAICITLVLIWTDYTTIAVDAVRAFTIPAGQPTFQVPKDTNRVKRALIIPKTRHDDVRWVGNSNIKSRFTPFIYTTDWSPEPQYLKPRTRMGREAAAYLSYILDYYDALPEYSIFVHAGDYQWHNDVFSKNTNQPDTLRNFRLGAVDAHGYVNLRCKQGPGCPRPMNVFDIPKDAVPNEHIRKRFVEMYMRLFNVTESDVPRQIGNVCCAQFAVSRKRIRQRPRADYERMMQWASETSAFKDFDIGWMFEKVWHIVFGMEAVLCPNFEQCRCDNFGWCGPLASGKVLFPAKAPKAAQTARRDV